MVHLLDDVLTVGKAQAGKMQFKPAPMDVKAFSKAVLEQLRLTDADRHCFTFIANGNLTNVLLDEELLRQILVNLLSNAIKYSPVGSEVCFEILREPDDILFLVKDHGLGIPKADQAHLFEAFHRAKNVAQIQGTGLGLTIVKANVETHGGSMSFDSQENLGTTFTVRLPARVNLAPIIPLPTF
jgi:signal transduction histidine kinase